MIEMVAYFGVFAIGISLGVLFAYLLKDNKQDKTKENKALEQLKFNAWMRLKQSEELENRKEIKDHKKLTNLFLKYMPQSKNNWYYRMNQKTFDEVNQIFKDYCLVTNINVEMALYPDARVRPFGRYVEIYEYMKDLDVEVIDMSQVVCTFTIDYIEENKNESNL